ncbi:uncharacterized protein [Clytia hemisphaerica]|uniref:Uncharacterized protein n=1 Tax=Clytia hemisphaerica TaxID=252671 RepID=A0A7M5U9L9_9CNID
MVRTYHRKADKGQMMSPWEKAMRNADSEEGRPVNTGKRVYAEMKVTKTSFEHHSTPRALKLPPITEDPQQMIQFLGEEVGKALARSKEKISKMIKEFVLYDPSQTSLMSKSSAFEILQRYKIPSNENYQKKVLALHVDREEPSKINYNKMVEFFENSRKNYLERLEIVQQQADQQSNATGSISDNTVGRYDSVATMNQVHNKPRKAHEQAFKERRDAGQLLEIEKALKGYRSADPEDLIDGLEESLKTTCRSDDLLTDNGHVRSLVNKHGLPINSSLTLKLIERLDPFSTGSIEWPKFIAFLRKSIGSSPRKTRTPVAPIVQQSKQDIVPERPAWELRQPLSSIGSRQSYRRDDEMHNGGNHHNNSNALSPLGMTKQEPVPQSPWQQFSATDDPGYHSNPSDPSPRYDNINNNNDIYDTPNNGGDGYYDDYHYENNNNNNNEEFPQMDDGLEAAFAKSVNELRSSYATEPEPEPARPSFEGQGQRGDIYKMVANALEDKAKLNQGRIHTNDVRKIMNYYNLLFDANFPMDSVNSILNRCSQNDEIYADQIIGMFGKEII